jgi:arylsulfatase A-like enzyme
MNFLVLICDELRYDALKCNGNPYVDTPNIDRLAARSVRFSKAFTSAPICSPARHSLMTGKYVATHGVLTNGMKPVDGLVTVADLLNERGYYSAQIGAAPKPLREGRGFETPALPDLEESLSEDKKKVLEWEHSTLTLRYTAGPSRRTMQEHRGFPVAEKAVQMLEEAASSGQKFHFWIGFVEPHPPFYPPKEFYAKFDQSKFKLPDEVPAQAPAPHPSITNRQERWSHLTDVEKRQMMAGYYGLVEMVDGFVGMVLDTLDRLKLADDTMIIFTADHGEQLGDHGMYTKFVMREPSVNVPLMVAHPSLAPGDCEELVGHVDLFPTLCDYAGAAAPSDLHGMSLRPLLENKKAPERWREEVISQINEHQMVRTREWKLNVYDGEPGELYRINEDPKEHINLLGNPAYSQIVEQLSATLASRIQS